MAAMQPTKMQSKLIISLQNSPNSENELMAETKSSDNDSSLSVGRTGRVRKAKVVFDPSEVENKRRSMPNMEAAKATKRSVATTANIASALVENKSILNDAELPSNATINKRRKTIGVAFENGCIVCTRADIKKGRFVNCIGCTKRGHYTCLRNGKLYKATDSEKRWQCPSCKICKACQEAQTNDQLYKCILCYNSFHLHCVKPVSKNTSRKRFTCTDCSITPTILSPSKQSSLHVSVAASVVAPMAPLVAQLVAAVVAEDPAKPKPIGKKYSGFAGFLKAEKTRLKGIKLPVKSKKLDLAENAVRSVSSKPPASNPKLKIEDAGKMQISKEIQTEQMAIKMEMKPPHGVNTANSMPLIAYDAASRVTPHENVPDCHQWDCDEVYTYFMGTATPEIAQLLKDNEIDGDALLLMKREDILRFDLKLGVALRLYAQIVSLQFKNNNPILVWNEF